MHRFDIDAIFRCLSLHWVLNIPVAVYFGRLSSLFMPWCHLRLGICLVLIFVELNLTGIFRCRRISFNRNFYRQFFCIFYEIMYFSASRCPLDIQENASSIISSGFVIPRKLLLLKHRLVAPTKPNMYSLMCRCVDFVLLRSTIHSALLHQIQY